ncbi:MAG TPA: EAL domain-containing protein [Burkholderiales bacterium]|nr:EAL domain-containing protein [Burkholderiales bacterium]
MIADALLLAAAISGCAVYLVMVVAARRRERELADARAHEQRLKSLTELSADWFWETDTGHRITWLSGGGPVATLFGDTATYGKRFWEIPRVEVDPGALEAHLERLEKQLPFFDLEISRADERGARAVHIVSGQSHHDEHGRFAGYRGVGRDVTEQRRAERGLAQAKERLEMALDGGNLAEWHLDLEHDELYAGDGWVRFLGHDRSPAVARGSDLRGLIHADDEPGTRAALVRVLKGEEAEFDSEFRIATKVGEWKWLHARARVTERSLEGRALRLSGIVTDIDARKHAEAAVVEADQRFRDVAAVSGEYVWEADAEWRYTYLSERVEALIGYPRAELLGRKLWEFLPLGEERTMRAWFAAHGGREEEKGGRPFRDLVHRIMTKSGGVIWQSLSGVPLTDADGRWIGYRGTAADVTPRKQDEARIEQLATRDALTGLANRSLLAERTAQAILNAARAQSQLALLAIDLDRFKLVNDSLGHAAGDVLLRAVAERLQNALRREDTLARLGGDDFALLWNGLKSRDEAAQLGERLLSILGRPFTIEGRTLSVGASIGIALYPRDGRDFAELLKQADAAMYSAKEAGRAAFRFFHPALGVRAAERLRVENDLRAALTRSELLLHWQPVVQGKPGRGGQIVGAEALVRWQHPLRGLLGPEEFVPLAEDSSLIRAIGEWTLERAFAQAGAWQRELPGKPWFAVNVSAPELAQGDAFVDKLKGRLAAHSLEGSRVELEVTERVLMSNFPENAETLRKIGALGVRFAIDDFGTGYSSLAYLRELPIDKLKIDRLFLRTIETDPADQAIVRTIAELAHTIGVAVAAEGLEHPGQLDRLLELGCEQWQGHLFSTPLDAPAFAELFRTTSAIIPTASPRAPRAAP